MWCYTIFFDHENKLPDILTAGLEACGFDVLPVSAGAQGRLTRARNRQIALVSEDDEGSLRMLHPHMVVVPPQVQLPLYAYRSAVSCSAAVLPGALAAGIAGKINAKCLVTYGMSSKDTITLSSTKDAPMLSIQREIIDLNGKRTDIQEIALRPIAQDNPEYIMAAAGVLLLSGVSPAELSSFL